MDAVFEHLEAVKGVDKSSLHDREVAYVNSFQAYASGRPFEAVKILQAMVVEYPLGMKLIKIIPRSNKEFICQYFIVTSIVNETYNLKN